MLTSYITARSRRRLIEALYKFEKAGLVPLYSDTDSIYVHFPPDYSQDLFEQHVRPLLNDNVLGAFKDETADDTGCDFMEATFVACKLYALRNPDGSKEVVKARGIPEYFVSDDSEGANLRRRLGAGKITYQDIQGLLKGKKIEFKREQITINQKLLLSSEHDNIKSHALMGTQVSGQYDKRIVCNTGECLPLVSNGRIDIPQQLQLAQDFHTFRSVEKIKDAFDE